MEDDNIKPQLKTEELLSNDDLKIGKQFERESIPLETLTVEKAQKELPNSFSHFKIKEQSNKFDIVIEDLGVSVKIKKPLKKPTHKAILHGVTARFKPGTLTAVMGSSGSGKSTLLNVILGRSPGKTTGSIKLNGEDAGKLIQKSSAYVMQQDILLSNLTVKETLTYAAQLRLPKTVTNEEREQIVDEIITTLNLTSCQDTLVGGGAKKGISGGQRKRVAIGQELLTDPGVIFLDEPTSGLDAATALNLVRNLREYSKKGRTIISTIHQPSSETFFMFDNLLLLANGHQIYYGPTKDMIPYFAKLGYKCPQYENPADFALNMITTGYQLFKDNEWIESDSITNHLIEEYKKVDLDTNKMLEEGKKYGTIDRTESKEQAHSEFTKYFILTSRVFKQQLREPTTSLAKLLQNIFFGVLIGLIYLDLENTQASIENRMGVLFFVVIQAIMNNMMGGLYLFPKERELYLREESSGCYGVMSYYFSKITAELPFQIVIPLVYSILIYFMVGLQSDAGKFFIFYAGVVVLGHSANAMATALTAGTGSFETSLIIMPVVFVPLMLFGGFFISNSTIPNYFIWIKYISPFKYGFELLLINEFTGLTFTCEDSELVNGVCPLTSGEKVISNVTDSSSSIWFSFLMLMSFSLVCHILAVVALKKSSKKPQA